MPNITVAGMQNGPLQIGAGLSNQDMVAYQQVNLRYVYNDAGGVPISVTIYSGPLAASESIPFPTVAVPGANTYAFQARRFSAGSSTCFRLGACRSLSSIRGLKMGDPYGTVIAQARIHHLGMALRIRWRMARRSDEKANQKYGRLRLEQRVEPVRGLRCQRLP